MEKNGHTPAPISADEAAFRLPPPSYEQVYFMYFNKLKLRQYIYSKYYYADVHIVVNLVEGKLIIRNISKNAFCCSGHVCCCLNSNITTA